MPVRKQFSELKHDCDFTRALQSLASMGFEREAVFWFEETGSTNDDAKRFCEHLNAPRSSLFVAQMQTQGRGTRGRQWINPTDSILMTVSFPINAESDFASNVTVKVGIAVASALRELGCRVGLKWPNDLWIRNGKCGGILCEVTHSSHCDYLVIGIGINLHVQVDDCISSRYCISDVHELNNSKWEVIVHIVRSIQSALYGQRKQISLPAHWRDYDAFYSRNILVETPDGNRFSAIDKGISDNGNLLALGSDGIVSELISARIMLG